MMKIQMKALVCAVVAALMILTMHGNASAATILKLSLGDTGPDVTYTGGVGGVLSTVNDLDGTTLGDQNTDIDFSDFLSGLTDITLPDASYTLSGVVSVGAPSIVFGTVVAPFIGGSYQLWDDNNALLLDVDLGDTVLSGPLGPSATGAVFSVTNGSVVGGSLAPLLVEDSLNMSISLTNVNGSAGLSTSPGDGSLNAFTADITKNIAATQVPEPTAALLVVLGSLAAPMLRRRRD